MVKVVTSKFRVSLRYMSTIIFVFFTMLHVTCSSFESIGNREGLGIDEIHIKEGLKVVETFYEYLFSDTNLKDCPEIFYTTDFYLLGTVIPLMHRVETYYIWQFVRQNRSLFTLAPEDINRPHFEYARKKYALTLQRTCPFDSALNSVIGLEIILCGMVDVRSGIDKTIAFPIFFCERTQRYRIAYSIITVNGTSLDWSTAFHRIMAYDRKYERDFDLFEHLGFAK
jgi:hypothetical protein